MKNEEIIRALRCISTAGGENACEHCPYWKEEEVPEEARPIYGADTMHSCDVDRVGLDGADLIERLTDRCAAYEDTGLEPEEVLPKDKADEIALNLMRLADLEILCNYARLRELAEADKDGRVVVLPCKVGDTLYEVTGRKTISEYRVKAIRVELFCVSIEWEIEKGFVWQSLAGITQSEIGKTVFLTREEAEAALEAMKDD